MTESDKVKMTINIGGEHFEIEDVSFKDQNLVRDAEYDARNIYDSYRKQRPSYTSAKILAMTKYRYALRVRQLEAMLNDCMSRTSSVDKRLGNIVSEFEKLCDKK